MVLIENDPVDSARLAEMVAAARPNMKLSTLAGGDAAIARFEQGLAVERPQSSTLVLLSLDLPASDGFRILSAVKTHPALRRIPIVAYSSSQAPNLVRMVYDMHANCFMVRPTMSEEAAKAFATALAFWFNTVELPLYS